MSAASISHLPIKSHAPGAPRQVSRPAAPSAAHAAAVTPGHAAEEARLLDADSTLPRGRKKARLVHGDFLLYVLLALLVAAAWQITQMQLIKSNDDYSYWIAVTGGSMMLLLFTYPLRKHLRFMQALGKVKWWFWFHLFLGVAGPWLILVHSTFRVGSLNAGVALYSMVIVVASGVIGRFIYVRVHRGLNGERMTLLELGKRARLVESDARSRLHFAPVVEARLLAFEQRALHTKANGLTHLRQVTLLPLQQFITALCCKREARNRLRELAHAQRWNPDDLRRRERRTRRLIDRYLDAVVRVAQYTAYERVFALWHLAHLPFVYLLIISAVVHVVAVHAY